MGRLLQWAPRITYGMRQHIEENFSSRERIFGEGTSCEVQVKVNRRNKLVAAVAGQPRGELCNTAGRLREALFPNAG